MYIQGYADRIEVVSDSVPPGCRGVHLDMQECREWVRSKLQTRGAKPFEFVRTVPCYNPSQSVANGSFSGKILCIILFISSILS